ncbi:16S rRNA (adenine(1518)-N(6)/adenine(1519)-N(6))-dimethyltransferase RsmA [Actinophytocola sp.]|uniref:16S rRNA (adenine(1518)-N(6)/adenine(1519)-N(6))- dimethyltransferase RsmA n=1 Tax=Actinophytocola sp. TaxID=1872138 RepID=UPI002D7FA35D|nr:16S rRNA (adenine(1518)-N(6)/adenine(1519)-N(6))-dimethyltransferase RsmA [Actinophytocola sp.]HET9143064.1 16S rRNA (adenine(1518)-N(6)/adenine(1519)-N(6))-dimethyltransferase RsmA [Actinophytocola sp.]
MTEVGLLGPVQVRQLAAELGVRPTKRLGQNFVHDPNTVRRIVETAGLRPDDVVLEVGPGLGSLTLGLLPAAAAVLAVEIDGVLAGRLPRTVAERAPGLADRLVVKHADALRITAGELDPVPTALVANLPYNVAVPVVLHLLAELPNLRTALVMVQAEVADRMAAGPGSRVYGVPSVKAAWFADVRRVATVPRSVFWPVPNVDSALVLLTRREPPSGADRAAVFRLVDAAFAQRRKTLRAALATWAGSSSRAQEVLRSAGVDPATRGEQLSVADFARIADHALVGGRLRGRGGARLRCDVTNVSTHLSFLWLAFGPAGQVYWP